MTNDLINRQQAIDAVMELIETGIEWRSGVSRKISLLNAVYCALEDIPSAESVRHGKWIRQTDTRFGEMLNDILICSECNIAFSTIKMIRRSYCPNCGARMDKDV